MMREFDYDAIITAEPKRTPFDDLFDYVSDMTDTQLVEAYMNRFDDLPEKARELMIDAVAHDMEGEE